jgi:hypothetical protein
MGVELEWIPGGGGGGRSERHRGGETRSVCGLRSGDRRRRPPTASSGVRRGSLQRGSGFGT